MIEILRKKLKTQLFFNHIEKNKDCSNEWHDWLEMFNCMNKWMNEQTNEWANNFFFIYLNVKIPWMNDYSIPDNWQFTENIRIL